MKSLYATLLRQFSLILAATTLVGCTDDPASTASVSSPGMLNGMLNGFFYTDGLTEVLSEQCPLLQQRLMETGDLEAPFSPEIAGELAKPLCEQFLFYTVQLMVPNGQTVALTAGTEEVASFTGKMGLQHLVQQAYQGYQFSTHAFLPQYPVARKVVTQAYAAFTNGITRRVSYKTNVPELDAHRDPVEDTWPREFLQLVPFTPAGIAAMVNNPGFLARMPDFFKPCDPQLINYDYLTAPVPTTTCDSANAAGCQTAFLGPQLPSAPPAGYCPLPVVVHGNLDFVDDVIPGRSCRILQPGEQLPEGTFLSGDVIVPEGGCPLIYYAGRDVEEIVYDDRAHNSTAYNDDGCDVTGPSSLSGCDFDVILAPSLPVLDAYLDYYVFNVEPMVE